MIPKCAFLVYDSWRVGRSKDKSFNGVLNIGVYMLINAAKESGIDIEFCSVDSAAKYDIVLVSFTSNYDVLAYAKAVFLHPNFINRNFKILGGGFGLQNPYPIQEYLDFAWFGRCENEITWLIKENLNVAHDSLLNLKNWKVCKVNQSYNLYKQEFKLGRDSKKTDMFKEEMYGCPNKCFYCHFTWTRKHINTGKHYDISKLSSSQELDMFNIEKYDPTKAKITVGLDGYSERLRKLVNRHNTDKDLNDFVIGVSNKATIKGKAVFLQMYNITGFETELSIDKEIFIENIKKTIQYLKTRLIIIIHSTPLHPSPLTPVAYTKVDVDINPSFNAGKIIFDFDKCMLIESQYMESSFALIESLVVERAQESTQKIFMDVVFNSKLKSLKSNEKLQAIQYKHDITPLIREYDVNENLPTWFIEGYMGQNAIKKMRLQMLRNLNTTIKQ